MGRLSWSVALLGLCCAALLSGCGNNVSVSARTEPTITDSRVTLAANPPILILPAPPQSTMPTVDLRWSYPTGYEYEESNFRMRHHDESGYVTTTLPFNATNAPSYYDYYLVVRSPRGERVTATARVIIRQP